MHVRILPMYHHPPSSSPSSKTVILTRKTSLHHRVQLWPPSIFFARSLLGTRKHSLAQRASPAIYPPAGSPSPQLPHSSNPIRSFLDQRPLLPNRELSQQQLAAWHYFFVCLVALLVSVRPARHNIWMYKYTLFGRVSREGIKEARGSKMSNARTKNKVFGSIFEE